MQKFVANIASSNSYFTEKSRWVPPFNRTPYSRYLHFCTHLLSVDGIKSMSSGILGGKLIITFTNTSNRGAGCLFYETRRRVYVQFEFRQVLCYYCLLCEQLRSLLYLKK